MAVAPKKVKGGEDMGRHEGRKEDEKLSDGGK